MDIAILDGVVIAVVFVSALLAMFRGFVREVLSIAAWVAAAILAYVFYGELMPFVTEYVNNRAIAIGLSAAAIFLVALIVVSLITMKIADYVADSPIGALDRLLGFLFGAARGLLLVIVAVIFFNWLVDDANRPAWVTNAATYEQLSGLGEDLVAALPTDLVSSIRGPFQDEDEPAPAQPAPTTPAPLDTNQQRQLDQVIEGATGTTDPAAAPATPDAPAAPAPATPEPATPAPATPAPATDGTAPPAQQN
ncbi:MAG: CvpA family protein [Devosia sp.]